MAFLNADNTHSGTAAKPLRLGLALGWLCLAAPCARADSPATPGFVPPSGPALPAAFSGLQPRAPGQATDLVARLGAGGAPLLLPLNVQFGHAGGVSFLYHLAAPTDGGKAPAAPRSTTYGFSNKLVFGHDALHLNGLMYLGSGPGADGKNKTSQVISQALAFENNGWKLDAHFQSVGKDFGGADALKGAAPSLGLASDLTAAVAGQLAGLRGQKDLGFGLAHTDARGSFGLMFKENDNAVSHLKTTEQSLSLGHTFGHGLQFEAARDTLSAKPTEGGGTALTTTTSHLKLGMDGGRGLSFSAEANLVGDTKGRAEQHQAYSFADQFGGARFAARFGSNSLKSGGKDGGKTSDQTLGVDIDRQSKGLGLKASFLQLTASGPEQTARTTEHLEWAAKDTQFAFNLQSNRSAKKGDATGNSDQTLGVDFGHQARGLGLKASFLQFAATGKDGERRTKTTEHLELALKDTQVALNLQSAGAAKKGGGQGDADKTLNLDLVRQTKGLSLKASLTQFTSTAKDGQSRTNETLEMSWRARPGVTLAGHWAEGSAQSAHPEPGHGGANREEKRDVTATLDGLRLRGLHNSRAVLSLAQAVSQGKMQSDTRALCFDTDLPDTRVHLEYTGSDLGWDKARSSLVSRAIRVASIAPGDWLHYSAYYKTRSQTRGARLTDIRDYSVGMRLRHVTLGYRYLNGQEGPDGCVRDTVLSRYEADGPLTRKLAWNLQYEHTDDRADKLGLESWLAGFKGDITPHESIAVMLGRPEMRVDGTTVPGQTFKMTFTCKLDDDDSVAFNGEVTNWSRKTKDTPSTVIGNFRMDVNKGF